MAVACEEFHEVGKSRPDNLSRDDCRAAFIRAFFRRHFSLFIAVIRPKGEIFAEVLIHFADADLLADRHSIAGSLARFVLCTSAAHFD